MIKDDISREFNLLLDKLEKKKGERIKDFEELKKRFLSSIDIHIDNLYKKRDYLAEVIANRNELRKRKIGVWKNFIRTNVWTSMKYLFSMPFIYMMILPGILLHFMLEIYHQVCFRIYRIPLVNPKEYFIFDRSRLPHLNWLERINCLYCSYYTSLAGYLQEIVGRTERFWCPIKHARRMANTHRHYQRFVDYSDAENLQEEWKKLRKFEEYKNKKRKKT